MTSRPDTPDVAEAAGSPDWAQLGLVLLAVLALVVAAFAAPPILDPGGGGSGSPGDGGDGGGALQPRDGGGESGSGGSGGSGGAGTDGTGSGEGDQDGGGGGFEIREPGADTFHPPGEPPYDEDELREALEGGCWVVAHSRPVPGRELTVSVWADREPRTGSRVWFNGELVGTTGEDGRVSGEVPYETAFEVSAAVPDADGCRFVTPFPGGERRRAVRGTPAFDGSGLAGASASLPGTSGGSRAQTGDETPNGTTSDGGETVSRTYTFRGTIAVRVAGAAYPGGEVTVVAALGGNPVEDGRVSVDGNDVGRTDSAGRYRLTVPDDAEGSLRIQIRRGDFTGSTAVGVHDLQLSLVPTEPLPLPGQPAVARVTLVGQPVPDAPVTLDGDRLGRTDENGTVGFVIPADPGATIETTGLGLRASSPVWPMFVPTVAAVLGTLAVGAVTTRRRWRQEGPAAGTRLAAAWAGVLAILTGYIVAGGPGALVACLAVALVLLVVLVRTRGEVAVETATTLSERLHALLGRLRRAILRSVDAIAAGVDWLRATTGRLLAWVAGQPRSVALLLGRLGAWLTALPGRVGRRGAAIVADIVSGIRETGIGTIRAGYSHRRLAVAVLAALAIGAASWEWAAEGALAVGIVLALGIVAWLLRRASAPAPEDVGAPSTAAAGGPTTTGAASGSGPVEVSLRELWRRFARRVAPGTWRTRTPVEVAQLAVERGLPAGPVERLTRAFREMEYGDRTLTPDEDATARAAYETLRETLAGEREVEEQ